MFLRKIKHLRVHVKLKTLYNTCLTVTSRLLSSVCLINVIFIRPFREYLSITYYDIKVLFSIISAKIKHNNNSRIQFINIRSVCIIHLMKIAITCLRKVRSAFTTISPVLFINLPYDMKIVWGQQHESNLIHVQYVTNCLIILYVEFTTIPYISQC